MKGSTSTAAGNLFPANGSAASVVAIQFAHHEAKSNGPSSARVGPYAGFYHALGELREEFHRIGRFDDANAKLEELCKLLVLAVLDRRHPRPSGASRLTHESLATLAAERFANRNRLAAALHAVHDELAAQFPDEFGSFGGKAGLSLERDDDEFAAALVPLLSSLPADEPDGAWSFDGVNEAFGHFIQDSFRNRKEDAQYMTPPEVVSPIVAMAVYDFMRDEGREVSADRPFRVADPTCGVGSFLAAAYRHALSVETPSGRLADHTELFGQDKVERMVRLANVNLRVFARAAATVRAGNSIYPPAGLNDWAGKIDLVVTNPPFGAEFETDRVLSQSRPEHFPTLHQLAASRRLPPVVGSEYILLDRELTLLRPGGRLLMVVPDHVVSGTGFSSDFRAAILRQASLEAVFDLPTETFAQAGTRTKTSVVYLRRRSESVERSRRHLVFMATADDLGFRVKSRAGATVKQIMGANDMDAIADCYRGFRERPAPAVDIACISERPSVAVIADAELLGNRWNAGFYRTERLAALQSLGSSADTEVETVPLADLADIDPPGSVRATAQEGYVCVSVLHVREDGSVDVQAARAYQPTTPCVRCQPGDVLLSRINPRIMRICVVPALGGKVACSAEFAILRPRKGGQVTSAVLAMLLRSDVVQAQVRTLTSGTSSSHNRVKPRDLREVRVPVPTIGSVAATTLSELAQRYESAMVALYGAYASLSECDDGVRRLLAAP